MTKEDREIQTKDQKWLHSHDQKLRDKNYWGELILKYHNGRIVRYAEHKTGKPGE